MSRRSSRGDSLDRGDELTLFEPWPNHSSAVEQTRQLCAVRLVRIPIGDGCRTGTCFDDSRTDSGRHVSVHRRQRLRRLVRYHPRSMPGSDRSEGGRHTDDQLATRLVSGLGLQCWSGLPARLFRGLLGMRRNRWFLYNQREHGSGKRNSHIACFRMWARLNSRQQPMRMQ